jgi:hypothetical protein
LQRLSKRPVPARGEHQEPAQREEDTCPDVNAVLTLSTGGAAGGVPERNRSGPESALRGFRYAPEPQYVELRAGQLLLDRPIQRPWVASTAALLQPGRAPRKNRASRE